VRKGGWSQKRYQRRRDHQLLHYARDVAEHLDALSRDEGFDRIVLIGSEETMVAIEAELHPVLRERVIARDNADLEDGEDSLVAAAFDHYWAAERVSEQQLWERVRAEYKAGALAAVGATDVLHAVQNGRAEALLIDREVSIQGVRCAACENTMHGTPTSCQICGARALSEVDLVNELTRQAELTGAEVEYADPIAGLSQVGGVAALLRY
jgi:peptide subunit release factor 1 (eRF1)